MSESDKTGAGARLDALVELIARLRGPGGCPWDREQTHASLKPMTIEEAYEVVEAIDRGDAELAAELGDLLLQVLTHAQIAAERGAFTAADVIDRVREKIVRRHPHVFGDEKAESSAEVLRSWEALKAEERAAKGDERAYASLLNGVSKALPAIMEAFQMTTKAARVGFEWPGAASVLEKLDEEVAELRDATRQQPPHPEKITEEVGDLLFIAVNVARLLGVDPESALKAANRKFRYRFRYVEEKLSQQGRKPSDSSLEEMEALWNEAKKKIESGE